MDGMLSQDEINALLSGMNTVEDEAADAADASGEAKAQTDSVAEGFSLSDYEKDAVGEISNISMGTAATTLSSLLNQKVNITTPRVEVATWDELSSKYDRPCVMLQISYKEGLDGNNVLVLKENDVRIITDLMMGGTGQANEDEPLTELHLSAIGEAMNQMMGSAATSMSSMFNRKIDISPPVANLIETYGEVNSDMPMFLNGEFVMVAFRMQIGEMIDSEIMQLYPIEFAQELVNMFAPSPEASAQETASQEQQTPPVQENSNNAQQQQTTPNMATPNMAMPNMGMQGTPNMAMPNMAMPNMAMPNMGTPNMAMPNMAMPNMAMPMQGMPNAGMQMMPNMQGYGQPVQNNVNVQSAAFQPFAGDLGALSQKENIDLIMDVPLEVTVELGRTTKSIKDILEFAPGTIVELNKIAGEAVDVLVNGKYVAKGEVVVIEESFGVRITEIIK